MKTVKIFLTSLLVLIWTIASVLFYVDNAMTGFYFTQLFFIPLISGVFLMYQERNLGIITLVFWVILIYGGVGGAWKDQVKFIPLALLILYLISFYLRSNSSYLKAISIVVSVLALISAIRLAKLATDFDWTIINEGLLLAIPSLLIAHVLKHERSSEPKLSALSIGMSILIAVDIIIRAAQNHVIEIPPTILTAISSGMLIVLGFTTYVLYRNNVMDEVRKISLSYFVWTLFITLGEWVVGSINDLS